jgi:hypothetical protein
MTTADDGNIWAAIDAARLRHRRHPYLLRRRKAPALLTIGHRSARLGCTPRGYRYILMA